LTYFQLYLYIFFVLCDSYKCSLAASAFSIHLYSPSNGSKKEKTYIRTLQLVFSVLAPTDE